MFPLALPSANYLGGGVTHSQGDALRDKVRIGNRNGKCRRRKTPPVHHLSNSSTCRILTREMFKVRLWTIPRHQWQPQTREVENREILPVTPLIVGWMTGSWWRITFDAKQRGKLKICPSSFAWLKSVSRMNVICVFLPSASKPPPPSAFVWVAKWLIRWRMDAEGGENSSQATKRVPAQSEYFEMCQVWPSGATDWLRGGWLR